MQLDRQFAVVGDFNVPGPAAGELDRRAADVFVEHGLRQHVNVATHTGGNILDLILTRDDDVSSRFVSQLAVASVCYSDHHVITCRLGVPPTPPVPVSYSFRQLRRMDMAAFRRDVLNSRLFESETTDAMATSTPSCSTARHNAFWTPTHRCSAAAASSQTKPDKPISCAVVLSVATGARDLSLTDWRTGPLVLQLATASRDPELTTSARNWRLCLATCTAQCSQKRAR